MSCPIPIRIFNPHYKKICDITGRSPTYYEKYDDCYIDVPCGKCYNCLKRYKSQWNFRLQQHYKYLSPEAQRRSYFVTLTFSPEHLPPSSRRAISRKIRLFLERVRKKYKRSVTHWFVTEHGDDTHRLHLHGILFDPPFPIYLLGTLWSYGWVSSAPLTPKRITYITSYVNKQIKTLLQDVEDKQYVFCSPGIGKQFADDPLNLQVAHYTDDINPLTYFNNKPFALPRYLRQKMFTPEQLELAKKRFFANFSDDVIPPPPYVIGHRVYSDYSVFFKDAEALRYQFNEKYLKPLQKHGKPIK